MCVCSSPGGVVYYKVSSKEIGAMGREVESQQGIPR
jgi:hypothetical protein